MTITMTRTLRRPSRPSRRTASGAIRAAAATLALLTPGLGAWAQASAPMATPMAAPTAESGKANQHRMRVSDMLGHKVLGAADKKVGDIKDLVVDVTSGKVRYALLEFDPGLFKADKLYAVPISAIGVDSTGKSLTYREVSRNQLMKATVDKKDWVRAVDNRRYIDGLDQNYGFAPPADTARSMRASQVIGRDVDSRAGKGIGKIRDLVVDMDAGAVRYAVFAFDPSWFAGTKLFAFPLTAFKARADKDELVLDVDKSMLASMKSFEADKWGHLNDLNHDAFINASPRESTAQ